MPHRFKVDDRVHFDARTAPQNAAEGFLHLVTSFDAKEEHRTWRIERLLPVGEAGYQYHIRCLEDGSQRLVWEAQIRPASRCR